MLTHCRYCKNPFDAPIKELNRGNARFCSISCARKNRPAKKQEPNFTCAQCGQEFYRPTSSQKNSRSGLFFCSRSCKDRAQRLDGIKDVQPSHYKDGSRSYRVRAIRSFGAICNRCGYAKIESVLEVHHKDRNRSNNELSNLEVLCPTCHTEEHLLSPK